MAAIKRKAYTAAFKLEVVNFAENNGGNMAAERQYGVSEKCVRDWRKAKDLLQQTKKSKKSNRGCKARWTNIEDKLEDFVFTQRAACRGLNTVQLRMKAQQIAEELGIPNFKGDPSWCFRFMKRKDLSNRRRTTTAQKLPADFEEKLGHFRFLRKVYGILTAQLLITTLTAAVFILHNPTKLFVQQNQWMLMVAIFGTFAVMIALMFKRQETPTNYILLFAFTIMEAYTVGVIVSFYDIAVVLEAFALTCAVTFGLSMYTLQTKRDFSNWGAGLFSVLWVLILAGFLQLFFESPLVDKLLAVGGAIIFSLFIVFDTHMMMHKLSPEEYIVASINLYLDIINLFLHILRIINESRK